MPGFLVSNMGKAELHNFYNSRCMKKEASAYGYYFAQNTLNKFLEDKCFCWDDDYVVISEGVITNRQELLVEYRASSIEEMMKNAFQEVGESFFSQFRGTFSGALYSARDDKWVIYTNQTGDDAIFYFSDELGNFSIGSQVNYVLSSLERNGVGITIDDRAIKSMLTYAFMYGDFTYAKEVKRLMPGSYLIAHDRKIEVKKYFDLKRDLYDLEGRSTEELIEYFDLLFKNAVKREYDVDEFYGYRHLSDLSGGLDSRMSNWVAHELGYRDVVNICYSQGGYIDEKVATEISADLGNEMLFKPEDSATFLFRPERIIDMNYGLGLYAGITAGEELLREINFDEFGVEHSGQLGGAVVRCYVKSEEENNVVAHAGMYSRKLIDILPELDSKMYRDKEEYLLTVRGFLGMQSSHFIRKNYTEVLTPFSDVDFLKFCLSIPVEERATRDFYSKWIMSKYPKAGRYVWEKEGTSLYAPKFIKKLKYLKWGVSVVLSEYVMPEIYSRKNEMNPAAYWLKTNPKLKPFLTQIFERYFNDMTEAEYITSWISELFYSGSVNEKVMAITAVLACRYYKCYGHDWHL